MKVLKDFLPLLLIGGAGYWAWQSGFFEQFGGQALLAAPPPAPPAPPVDNGGPVYAPVDDPPPVRDDPPPVRDDPPPDRTTRPPVRPPTRSRAFNANRAAAQLNAAGGAAPKNVWQWNYYVQQMGYNFPSRDPWGVLGNSVADIEAVLMTAPEYVAYLTAESVAGLAALACACVNRSTRI